MSQLTAHKSHRIKITVLQKVIIVYNLFTSKLVHDYRLKKKKKVPLHVDINKKAKQYLTVFITLLEFRKVIRNHINMLDTQL